MNETTTMPVTLTTNYRDVLNPDTLRMIDVFLEEEYNLSEMLAFIDKHGEIDFKYYFEDYKHWAGYHNPEVADFFVKEFGLENLLNFQDIYVGMNLSDEAIFENLLGDRSIPNWVCVDYSMTVAQLVESENVYRFLDTDGDEHCFADF